MSFEGGEVTELLRRLGAGDRTATPELVTLVYDELRRLARVCMRREGVDHTLQPTALVHEAWLRLAEQRKWNLENRAHFFGMAAQMMRRILIDHAREARAAKRGGGESNLPLENALVVAQERPAELLDVHRALERLEALDPARARVAELRFFGGFSVDEISEITSSSARTVDRQWRAARAWLSRELAAADNRQDAEDGAVEGAP